MLLFFGQSSLDGNYLLNVILSILTIKLLYGSCSVKGVWNFVKIVFEIKSRFDLLLLFDEILHFGLRGINLRFWDLGLLSSFDWSLYTRSKCRVGVLFDLLDFLLSLFIVVLNGFDFFHELIGFLDTLLNELLGRSLLFFRLDELFHLLLNHFIVFFS